MTKRHSRELTHDELAKIRDQDIDFSDIPELDEDWFKSATVVYPEERKRQLTMRLDPEVVDWFKSQGRGYQTRMNAVLRAYYEAHKDKPGRN